MFHCLLFYGGSDLSESINIPQPRNDLVGILAQRGQISARKTAQRQHHAHIETLNSLPGRTMASVSAKPNSQTFKTVIRATSVV
jgi:hypothetical protein